VATAFEVQVAVSGAPFTACAVGLSGLVAIDGLVGRVGLADEIGPVREDPTID
jgi:hypothetical protein